MAMMKRTFNTVMAYEDACTAERAKKAWNHLECTLQGHSDPGLRLWKFDVLRTPEVREVAATDAARADMVLIATRGAGELPTEVKALVQKRRVSDNQSTLAALFDALPRTSGISVVTTDQLRSIIVWSCALR
jgi:hypothetical protein